MARCKLCGNRIVWTVSPKGSFLPVEPDTIDLQGELNWDTGEAAPMFDEDLGHELHFNYCEKRRKAPPPTAPREPTSLELAYSRLHVIPAAHIDVVRAAYRALTKLHHPDVGGDHETMLHINLAIEQIERARGLR